MEKWLYVVCFWFCGGCANHIQGEAPGVSTRQNEIMSLWKHCIILVSCEKNNNISLSYDPAILCLQQPMHPLTRQCMETMISKKSLVCLEETWRFFLSNYRSDSRDEADEVFLKEFGVILFCFYRQIFLNQLPLNKVAITEVLSLSSQIASLPLDRVIEALNVCYDRLKIILGRYAPKPGMSLSAWVQMYWWVPPVVLLSSIYSVVAQLLFRQAVGSFFSSTHLPRPPTIDSDDGQDAEESL